MNVGVGWHGSTEERKDGSAEAWEHSSMGSRDVSVEFGTNRQKIQKYISHVRHLGDSNSQSLPPESNALPLGQGVNHEYLLLYVPL